jgi:hypothetical protein
MVWEAMSEAKWSEKGLDEMERQVQEVVNQVGHRVMQDFLVPARVRQIEQQVEAGAIRCQGCDGRLQRHKKDQAIHPKTIFGEKMTISRDQFYCQRCDQYPMVADHELGLLGPQMTPRLAVVVLLCGASWGYEVGSAFLAFLFGVNVPAKTIQRVTQDERVKLGELGPEPLSRPPGVVTMDGVLIRGRERGQWLETKVGSFFSQVVPVSRQRNEVLDASFVASAKQEWTEFHEPVLKEAQRRGLSGLEPVEFVSDGAAGIWELQQTIFPLAQLRLDQYHTKCKIGERLEHAYGRSTSGQHHQRKVQDDVENGLVDQAVTYLQRHRPRDSVKQQAVDRLIGYLQRHRQRIPNYRQIKSEGGTVSSGLMEKANDVVVVRRLKEKIMHWSREGAHAVILHRTTFINQHARSRTGPYDLAFCYQ